MQQPLVDFSHFIVATRDSGYKNTASALAELVDNAIQALATKIEINFIKQATTDQDEYEVIIIDNGRGMSETELNQALQFGGSSRFNARKQLGRYGMGLPNSSLSQCKRVEVTTWQKWNDFKFTYLDVDEVITNGWSVLPQVESRKALPCNNKSNAGTVVQWKKCDRLSFKYLKTLLRQIHLELGRIYRYSIWKGVQIQVQKEIVQPFDPLFLGPGKTLIGGEKYGSELKYEIRYDEPGFTTSLVKVRFVELPVSAWARWSNEEKRKQFITKSAGVSVLRAGREIDYGWFFMGEKRKENYDDWWRCEIAFEPELDEVFGVTHTKQQIRQTEFMNKILAPDLEQSSRILSNRVRMKFMEFKQEHGALLTKTLLERNDRYMPALKLNKPSLATSGGSLPIPNGMQYELLARDMDLQDFYEVAATTATITLTLNKSHPFYTSVLQTLMNKKTCSVNEVKRTVEFMIVAAARAELSFKAGEEKKLIARFRNQWSNNLKTLIS